MEGDDGGETISTNGSQFAALAPTVPLVIN